MIQLFNKKNKIKKVSVDQRLKHIAFIMDGNGRWAQKRNMPREYGHSAGAKVFKQITEYCGSIGIDIVTVYAFSTENWKRPQKEVNSIIKLLKEYLFEALNVMMKKNICIKFLGDRSIFDENLQALMNKTEEESKNNKLILNIAINYGGKDEIVHAVNTALSKGKTHITAQDIEENLYTSHCPPPDLIVRTGSEMRLSNFLMWQSAYSELYFTDILWPDFKESDVDRAIEEFYSRKRRFGGI